MRWQPEGDDDNFGDCLGPEICELEVARLGLRGTRARGWRRVWSVGSVMHRARAGDVVWGAGANGKALGHRLPRSLDIRAVRGPLTAQWVRDQRRPEPAVFGDPALLLPALFPHLGGDPETAQHRAVVVMAHYDDVLDATALPPEAVRVDPREPWLDCVTRLADARFVLSSSLHGLIVAEAFGVPARMLRLSESEPLFKYRDYYESTGRPAFEFARTIAEGMEMGGEPPGAIDLAPLEAAFPTDLWRSPTNGVVC